MTVSDLLHLKTALVYDRVNTPYGGAEKVLLALHQLFPQAPLYTGVYDARTAAWAQVFSVKASLLNQLPFLRSRHRWLALLMPIIFESFDLSAYELIISVTSAEAKGIITRPGQLHICYLLSPSRYLYSHRQFYLDSSGLFSLSPFRYLANKLLDYLSWWDQAASHRPDHIIPISQLIVTRTKRYYQRRCLPPIYPPIQSIKVPSSSSSLPLPPKYLLVVSRLVPYKRIDLAIKACLKLNRELVIVGSGPALTSLKQLANHTPKIHFLENLNDDDLYPVINQATALLMPGVEDFGLIALEAQALGKPVIAHHLSGAAEVIKHLEHGIHLEWEKLSALVKAIKLLEKTSFDKAKIQRNVRKYDLQRFKREFAHQVLSLYRKHITD